MNKAKLVYGLALTVVLTGQAVLADDRQWFRGQMHAHSYWSDGRGFPEQAVAAYKQRGYNFLSMTEHNRFAEDTNTWRAVAPEEASWPPEVSQGIFDAYVHTFGKKWVESRTDGSITSVRLKTYAEIKTKFEDHGKFILLPGVELTQTINEDGHEHVHQNYINLPLILPCILGADLIKKVTGLKASQLIALNASETEQAAITQQKPYMLILNHPYPLDVSYNIAPQNLINCPEIRFFDICNSGSTNAPHPQALTYNLDKFWDIVNAFRCYRGQPLLYGVGTDDAHFYDAERINGYAGVDFAWVMVRAASLTPEHLLAAMHEGDFYASSGVLLKDVTFTPADKTLRVTVKTEPGVEYKIHFISTKRGFDQAVTEIASPAGNGRPACTIPVYSDDIGRTVKTVVGTTATYRLEADDLYVRARVESDSPSKIAIHFYPKVKTAWTQPYANIR